MLFTDTRKIRPTRLHGIMLVVATVGIFALSYPAHTQNQAGLEAEFEAAFGAMIQDPGDLGITLRYANLAVQLQNYEAAIPALERVLFFNPDLPDIRLEIGVMYYKLGSYDVARDYLNDTLAPGTPDDVRQKASAYLVAMGG